MQRISTPHIVVQGAWGRGAVHPENAQLAAVMPAHTAGGTHARKKGAVKGRKDETVRPYTKMVNSELRGHLTRQVLRLWAG